MVSYPLDPDAVQMALTQQLAWANQGRTVLYPFIGRSNRFQAWEHYPRNDVTDDMGAWQFYYHAHDQSREGGERHPAEHGHIHFFRRSVSGALSHVAGLSLDAKGTPLTWFATNQWVTGEEWKSANALVKDLAGMRMATRGPLAGAAKWLACMVHAYHEPICEMLKTRDKSLAQHCKSRSISKAQARADRGVAVWSTHPIDWFRDARQLNTQISSKHN
jgi:hypothetical protein